MPYKLNKIRNITPHIIAYEVVGDFPVEFWSFCSQILRQEKSSEVTFSLPSEARQRRRGTESACVIRMTRRDSGVWEPADNDSSDWYSEIKEERVVSCTVHGGFGKMCYNLTLATKEEASSPKKKAAAQKVKVRFSSDYIKHSKPRLIALLQDRDNQIDRLRRDLADAREMEEVWKAEAAKLAEENRVLKAGTQPEGRACTQTAPAKTEGESTNPKKPVMRLIEGPCFHGETWYTCPHCGKGVEWYSLKKTNKPNIYLCPYCKNAVTERG